MSRQQRKKELEQAVRMTRQAHQKALKQLDEFTKQLEKEQQQLENRPLSQLPPQQRNLNDLLKKVAQKNRSANARPIYPGRISVYGNDDTKILTWSRMGGSRESVRIDRELVKRFLQDRLGVPISQFSTDHYGGISINLKKIPQQNRQFTV
jgi:ATP-dependent Clp protease ATP-binding subunit ClpA